MNEHNSTEFHRFSEFIKLEHLEIIISEFWLYELRSQELCESENKWKNDEKLIRFCLTW